MPTYSHGLLPFPPHPPPTRSMLLPSQLFVVSNRDDAIHEHHATSHRSIHPSTNPCIYRHILSHHWAPQLSIACNIGNAAVAAGAFKSFHLLSRKPPPTSSYRFQQPTTNHPHTYPATAPTYLPTPATHRNTPQL
ncbi:unnamed protein product [Mesocestoides corti]|uniref:Uncharacterized protein n=1 Tax=Mesocestoides corti TaxID=53468 RepID=A0A0R3UQM2_MESCO|nr:unnamed protein product [Mesocestoides corti]